MAVSKPGEAFVCRCCKKTADQWEASNDAQLGGPVCEDCRKELLYATAWLKKADIDRPVMKHDVNEHNYKRFIVP